MNIERRSLDSTPCHLVESISCLMRPDVDQTGSSEKRGGRFQDISSAFGIFSRYLIARRPSRRSFWLLFSLVTRFHPASPLFCSSHMLSITCISQRRACQRPVHYHPEDQSGLPCCHCAERKEVEIIVVNGCRYMVGD